MIDKWTLVKRGQSLVEVALVLPILVILLVGIIEVGFFLFTHVQVANAVRSGARAGSLCREEKNCATLPAVVETAVYDEAEFLNMGPGNTTINVQPASPGDKPPVGSAITVTVTYMHTPPFVSIFVPMFPSPLPVQHTSVMRFSN